MAPVTLRLLPCVISTTLAVTFQRSMLEILGLADPTVGGQMSQFMGQTAWIQGLLANRAVAQSACAARYPLTWTPLSLALKSPDNPLSLAVGCTAVATQANGDHVSKPYLAAAGGLEMAMAAMRAFPGDKSVQRACAGALGGMSLYQFDVMEEAGRLGAVELVLDMERRWPNDPSMQVGGINGCFNDFSYTNRERWQKAGGVAYNVETIRRHYNNSEVVLQCWFAFSSGTQAPNQRAFVEAGGIEEGMRCMNDHKSYSRTREEIMQAMRAVGMASQEFTNRLVEEGFLENLATAMREVPQDIHTQSPACANVGILIRTNATHRARAVKDGLVELSMRAVHAFPSMVSSVNWAFNDQYTVYEDCLSALANLVEDEEGKQIFMKIPGAAADIAAAMKGRKTAPVQMNGGKLLLLLHGQ